jgi:hypothetical protein
MQLARTRAVGVLAAGGLAIAAGVATAGSALAVDNSPGFGGRDIVRGNAEYRFAERSAPAQLNGQGPKDLFVGVPFSDAGGKTDSGRVFAMDGGSLTADPGTVLYEISPPGGAQQDAHFGFFISTPGDLVGNGVPDLVVGADEQDVDIDGDGTEESDVGKAWVFDGADGTMSFALTNPNPQAGGTFGERIGSAGDVNGDGVPDIIVGAPGASIDIDGDGTNENNVGQAYVLSGADGSPIYTINSPDPQAGAKFGLAVQGPGDLGSMAAAGDPSTTQDGVVDLLVNAALFDLPGRTNSASEGRSYVFSGQDVNGDGVLDGSELLTRIDSPDPQSNEFFGFQDVKPLSPGDVNGDGYPDLYGNGFNHDVGDNVNQGRAWAFDGQASVAQTANGVVLHQFDDPDNDNHGRFGWSMTRADHNGGAPDLYIGQAPHPHAGETAAGEGTGGSYVFDGADAALLQTLDLPTPECDQGVSDTDPGPALGWTTSAPGDLDGDGQPDYVAGGPMTNVDMSGTRQEDAGSLVSFNSNLADNIDQCSSD